MMSEKIPGMRYPRPFANMGDQFPSSTLDAMYEAFQVDLDDNTELLELVEVNAREEATAKLRNGGLSEEYIPEFAEHCVKVTMSEFLEFLSIPTDRPQHHLDPMKCLIAYSAYLYVKRRNPGKKRTVCRRTAELLGPGVSNTTVVRAVEMIGKHISVLANKDEDAPGLLLRIAGLQSALRMIEQVEEFLNANCATKRRRKLTVVSSHS